MSYDEDNMPGGCFSLLLALVIATPLAAQEATASITGIVVDPTGARIAAASVDLTSQDSGYEQNTRTDNEGSFRFTNLAPGAYILVFRSPGFLFEVKPIMLLAAEQRSIDAVVLRVSPLPPCGGGFPISHAISFKMAPRAPGGQITSQVVLGDKRTPAPRANVLLVCNHDRMCAQTRTDNEGWFKFSALAPGSYSIRIEFPEFYKVTVDDVDIVDGVEFLYSEIYVERCPKGNCNLRPKSRRAKNVVICL